jgi:hypothetical protein
MYVDLLSAALADDDAAPKTRQGLSSAAIASRARLLDSRMVRGGSAVTQLAREVAYDRSLISLCLALGVDARPGLFAQPAHERARLEHALAEVGEDLIDNIGRPRPGPD